MLTVAALLVSLALVGIGAASWGADLTISGSVSMLPEFPSSGDAAATSSGDGATTSSGAATSSGGQPGTSSGGVADGGTVAGAVYAGQR